jgi:hypothetical protein
MGRQQWSVHRIPLTAYCSLKKELKSERGLDGQDSLDRESKADAEVQDADRAAM